MDKDNLYYIVDDGTNVFELIPGCDKPWIATKERAEKKAKYNSDMLNHSWITMSIREYEEKFTEKAPEVKKEPASYNLYSTGKHLLGLYNNKVIVIKSTLTSVCPSGEVIGENLSVDKVITDEIVVLHIREHLYNIRLLTKDVLHTDILRRVEIINELIEELIEKAT